MNIYAGSGYKVIGNFVNGSICGGYDDDKEHAMKYIKENVIYTIDYTDVSNWRTDVYLQELPDISFNSVYFIGEDEPDFVRVERSKKSAEDGIDNIIAYTIANILPENFIREIRRKKLERVLKDDKECMV